MNTSTPRTRTISRWTLLSGHRIRALYKNHALNRKDKVTRHHSPRLTFPLAVVFRRKLLRTYGSTMAGPAKRPLS